MGKSLAVLEIQFAFDQFSFFAGWQFRRRVRSDFPTTVTSSSGAPLQF